MPDIVTHHHFGKVVYGALSNDVKKSINDLQLYDFATAGPDPFFYINFLSKEKQKENQSFGNLMHTRKTKEFFIKLIEIAKVDYYMFNYLCGFITHYFLDSYTHPYIFYKTGVYNENDETTSMYRGQHLRFERAIDAYIIENYYLVKTHKYKIHRSILKLKKLSKNSKASFDKLYLDVYGLNSGFNYVNKAIKYQRKFYHFIYDPFGLKNKFLNKIDNGTSSNDYRYLSYYNRMINDYDIFNYQHTKWTNPINEDLKYHYDFFELFEQAKENCVNCISEVYNYVYNGVNMDFEKYFDDRSYLTGLQCSYNLEMKYFENNFKNE